MTFEFSSLESLLENDARLAHHVVLWRRSRRQQRRASERQLPVWGGAPDLL